MKESLETYIECLCEENYSYSHIIKWCHQVFEDDIIISIINKKYFPPIIFTKADI